ncbi:MAG: ATP-dependent DNA helicase RecG [Eubacteriales bacterium]|nr:ATP-dependent DNA helicase RecG [Eubacteriales bacterium]
MDRPITEIKGIGNAKALIFARGEIRTIFDLLSYYPRSIQDRSTIKPISQLKDGDVVCIQGMIQSKLPSARIGKGRTMQRATVVDENGKILLMWFNQPYILNSIKEETEYTIYGKITTYKNKPCMIAPIIESSTVCCLTGRIVPIYPLFNGLTQKMLQKAIGEIIHLADSINDNIPQEIIDRFDLYPLSKAIRHIHQPESALDFENARRRLAFDELLKLHMGIKNLRNMQSGKKGVVLNKSQMADEFINSLPYKLTEPQQRVYNEIKNDLRKTTPMSRLVQGDVGCGKTVIAAGAMAIASENGYQSAFMAPTEILARQHYDKLSSLLKGVCLVTGSMNAAEKKEAYNKIQSGQAKIIIGTHALIQDRLVFNNLALVITDEQHRFGVDQRKKLEKKGLYPHILVMSATPIPRTLAMILYGDLDISIIDAMPPGRKPIKTYCVGEDYRERINSFMQKQADEGHQIYVVCPLIEEGENTSDLMAVTEYAEKLKEEVFPHTPIAILHGGMPPKEKEKTMKNFAENKIAVLVSTTVIEVGVDVPNATLIVIENAERFGLAQLHQLRGRVGRGKSESSCVLIVQSGSDLVRRRMGIMTKTTDGFKIAEEDLLLRGPGDFFGTRQHGLPEMKIANLYTDIPLLHMAKEASELIK